MSERMTDAEMEQLNEHWTALFEDTLATSSSTAQELAELAEQHRALARLSDSPGQRRAFDDSAERYDRVARERAAAARQ